MTEFDKYSDLMNLIGYGLAKFDMDFVKEFGFKTRSAFYQYCVDLGFAKTIKSVTNRQDSFDPYFDNGRKGWYQRNQREHIKLFIDSLFGNEDAAGYVGIVKLYIQDTSKKIEIPVFLYISLHFYQLAALHFLAIHVEGHEVHALWQRTWAPSVGVLAEGVGSSIRIYGQTCHVGKYQSYLVLTRLSYYVWDIHLGGEWVRIW